MTALAAGQNWGITFASEAGGKTVHILDNTDHVPACERFLYWQERVRRLDLAFDLRSDDTPDFNAELRAGTLDKIGILVSSSTNSYSLHRASTLIRRSDPEMYRLVFNKRGGGGVTTDRGDLSFGHRELLLCDSSRIFDGWRTAADGKTEWIMFSFTREALPLPATIVKHLVHVPMSTRTGLGALVATMLQQVTTDVEQYSDNDSTRLSNTVLDLTAAVLAHMAEADTLLPEHSRRVALLSRIHAFMNDRLADPDLGPETIAAAHHISVRYLHKLFQAEHKTVAESIRNARLERCRRDLADPALLDHPVHVIGARWGLGTPAQFSRAFRAAYDITPRNYRHSRISPAQCADSQSQCTPRQ